MKECIFCKIIGGADPQKSNIVKENEEMLAMLDSHPLTIGHAIIFPKKHFANLEELAESRSRFWDTALSWMEQFQKLLGAKAYVIKMNNNLYALEDSPLHVGHVHLHFVPRYTISEKADAPKAVNRQYFFSLLDRLKVKTGDG